MRERRRVVNEEGSVASDRRKAASRFSDALFVSMDDSGSDSGCVRRSGSA